MDMVMKFIQMGMTRAKWCANYKGGRKFVNSKGKRKKLAITIRREREGKSRIQGGVGDVQVT